MGQDRSSNLVMHISLYVYKEVICVKGNTHMLAMSDEATNPIITPNKLSLTITASRCVTILVYAEAIPNSSLRIARYLKAPCITCKRIQDLSHPTL